MKHVLMVCFQLDPTSSAACGKFVQKLICQECSPYAAHLYDAEVSLSKTALPGLCSTYCADLYRNCQDIVPYLTDKLEILDALASSEKEFCEVIEIGDMDYCYPDLLTNTILNQELINNTRTEDGCLCLEELTGALRNPLLLRTPDDGTGRLFVAEQVGIVHIYYKNGSKIADPFMNLTDVVLTSSWRGDERGLLGLAFHPNFKQNGRLFVYFSIRSEGEQHIRISEFQVDPANPNKVNRTSERIVLQQRQPYWNHNGGEVSAKYINNLMCNVTQKYNFRVVKLRPPLPPTHPLKLNLRNIDLMGCKLGSRIKHKVVELYHCFCMSLIHA